MNLLGLDPRRSQAVEEPEQVLASLVERRRPVAGPRVECLELPLDLVADRPFELPRGLDLDPTRARLLDHPAQEAALAARPWLARLQVMVDWRPAPAGCTAEDACCAEIGAQADVAARAVE